MRRYLPPSAVNRPVWLGDYTRTMMIKRILMACAVVAAAAAAGTSLAHAQQGYPISPGSGYSATPAPYPPGGYIIDDRRQPPGAPDFDELEDDEAPNAQSSTALPPPGPVLSPNDPRYGRPAGAPVYSAAPNGPMLSPDDPRYGRPAGAPVSSAAPNGPILSPDDPRYGRPAGAPVYSAAPNGPVLSPDDPRYGRPAGPPPVIYGDRPAGPPQPTYSDRGDNRIPGSGIVYPNDDRPRPPEGIGAPTNITGAVQQQPAVGADGRPIVLSALPPEEQPEVNAPQLPAHLRRQEIPFATKEPAGTLVVDTPNT